MGWYVPLRASEAVCILYSVYRIKGVEFVYDTVYALILFRRRVTVSWICEVSFHLHSFSPPLVHSCVILGRSNGANRRRASSINALG